MLLALDSDTFNKFQNNKIKLNKVVSKIMQIKFYKKLQLKKIY